MEKTIRLERELAYTGTILKVYRDTVVANGIQETYDYIHHDGAGSSAAGDKGWKALNGAPVQERTGPVYSGAASWKGGCAGRAPDRMCVPGVGGGDRVQSGDHGISYDPSTQPWHSATRPSTCLWPGIW